VESLHEPSARQVPPTGPSITCLVPGTRVLPSRAQRRLSAHSATVSDRRSKALLKQANSCLPARQLASGLLGAALGVLLSEAGQPCPRYILRVDSQCILWSNRPPQRRLLADLYRSWKDCSTLGTDHVPRRLKKHGMKSAPEVCPSRSWADIKWLLDLGLGIWLTPVQASPFGCFSGPGTVHRTSVGTCYRLGKLREFWSITGAASRPLAPGWGILYAGTDQPVDSSHTPRYPAPAPITIPPNKLTGYILNSFPAPRSSSLAYLPFCPPPVAAITSHFYSASLHSLWFLYDNHQNLPRR
jgi:hypothetical protein